MWQLLKIDAKLPNWLIINFELILFIRFKMHQSSIINYHKGSEGHVKINKQYKTKPTEVYLVNNVFGWYRSVGNIWLNLC